MRRTSTSAGSFGNETMGMGMRGSTAGAVRLGPDGSGRTSRRVVWMVVAVLVTLVVALGWASSARAAFGFEDAQTAAGAYNADGSDQTQAGAIPFEASTDFTLNSVDTQGENCGFLGCTVPYGHMPDGNLKDLVADLPPGIVGNPDAVPKCPRIDLANGDSNFTPCPPETQVGVVDLTFGGTSGASLDRAVTRQFYPVYNVVPRKGDLAEFFFVVQGVGSVPLIPSVRNGDHGVRITMSNAMVSYPVIRSKITLWGVPADPRHDEFRNRVCITSFIPGAPCAPWPAGQEVPSSAQPKAFLRNPTSCGAKPQTVMFGDSWQDIGAWKKTTAFSPAVTGCDKLSFSPTMDVQPDNATPDSPTGLDVNIDLPQIDDTATLAYPDLKKVSVTLPEGMTINPSGAGGLTSCSDADLGLLPEGTTPSSVSSPEAMAANKAVTCPASSKIGTVEATSPLLSGKLTGGVYIRSQASMDPESGEMFRLALVLENKDRGISVRLPGSITADARTGRLVTTFDNNPQLPVSNIKLHFKSGARAPLATPKACGPKTVNSTLESWAGQTSEVVSHFQVACTPGLGWFGPYFSAGTVNPAAGASSPFVLRVNKPDGQSDLNGLSLQLPEGLLANLKGNIGTRVGTARVAAGPGTSPYWLSGPVVLEGPYGGAPFSLRVTVPAVAGPFNLGNVVVRQKLYVDPHDAHVTVVSDPLPTIVQGVPVRLQSLAVDIDKPGFMRNPTSCAPKSIGGTLGAATGQTAAVSARFQVGGCGSLPLAPRMAMQLQGKEQVRRGQHPTLVTQLTQQPGESNLKSVKVRLPLSLALDPDNAEALCKPEQAAAKACPKASIVGSATAVSPVLNRPLHGDVFFVEGTRKSKTGRTVKTLPKLWVALRGEVAIDLWADSSISKGKYLVTTFPFVPDAPISAFRLRINGGAHGILAVTGDTGANLCNQANVTQATYDGQNGKQVLDNVRMSSPCGFKVRSTSVTKTHAKVTLSGLGAGKLSISGKGIHKASRTIKHADVATITPRLTASGMRTAKRGKALRLRVTWNPKQKGARTRHAKAVVKRAKVSSSTRSRRLSRTR